MRILVAGANPQIKTKLACAWLCANTNYAYYKPIRQFKDNDYKFIHELSPHTKLYKSQFLMTKKQSGQAIPIQDIQYPMLDDIIFDSPANLMAPINSNECVIDLIKHFNANLILVVSATLGSLNQTLFNIETVHKRNLPFIGIIVNDHIPSHIHHALEYFGQVRILAKLPDSSHYSYQSISDLTLPKLLQKKLSNSKEDHFSSLNQ